MTQVDPLQYKISSKTKILNLARRLFMLPIAENWLAKRTSNKKASSFWCKLIPPEYLYHRNSYRTIKVNDATLRLNISNVVDHAAFWGYEDKAASFFLSQLHREHTVIDIGANIGIFSTYAAIRSNRVISIEPDIRNFSRLEENLALNNITNATALNVGLGCRAGKKRLYRVVESNPGMNRVMDKEIDAPYTEIQIETLDRIIENLNISKIDIVKIDTEGYEMNILNGAINCLEKFKPSMMLEIDDRLLRLQSSSTLEILHFLKGRGYDIYDITNERIIMDLSIQMPVHFDIWCSVSRFN